MSADGDGGGSSGGGSSRTLSVTSSDGFLSPPRGHAQQQQSEVPEYSRLDSDQRSAASSATTNDASTGSVPDDQLRRGTLPSAVFNLLSTMVGGGSLSLPLAFAQSGNALVGPVCLILTAIVSEFCMRCLVDGGEAVEAKERKEKKSLNNARRRGAEGDGGEEGRGEQGGDEHDAYDNEVEEDDDHEEDEEDDPRLRGHVTYELIASSAFGLSALYLSMALIAVICFFATVGYAVLLRDLLEPYVDYLAPPPEETGGGPTFARNVGMWLVVLGITPLCRLTELTPLRHVGAVSMAAVLTLGFCVAYRSWECNFSPSDEDGWSKYDNDTDHGHGTHNDTEHGGSSHSGHSSHIHPRHDDNWVDYLTFIPQSLSSFLSALPIYVSCFICHYNVPPVCNELSRPTTSRKYAVIRATVWCAFAFYILVGFAGSMYGNCTSNGTVQGNVLLDFDESDPLLLVGRTALACTVALAFPMLVIPPRDIALRGWGMWRLCYEMREEERTRRTTYQMGTDENGHNDEGHDGDHEDERRKKSRFSSLLRRGRGRVHPPSGAFPPTLSVPEDEIGITMTTDASAEDGGDRDVDVIALTEPLLHEDEGEAADEVHGNRNIDPADLERSLPPPSPRSLLLTAIVIFWSAASVASKVKSVDMVWDLLGSSLSICLGFLIPCGSYALLFGGKGARGASDSESGADEEAAAGEDTAEMMARRDSEEEEQDRAAREEEEVSSIAKEEERKNFLSARAVVWVFVPLMVVCTANAFYRTFLMG